MSIYRKFSFNSYFDEYVKVTGRKVYRKYKPNTVSESAVLAKKVYSEKGEPFYLKGAQYQIDIDSTWR